MHRLHQLPPMKVAEELLLIDSSALRMILPDELVDEAWVNKRKEELSPNITAMVHHFNRVALLVPTEILAEVTPQARAKVISSFIKVAEACHQLKNYHSLKAVLAGLQCTPIYRLKKSWKRVPTSRLKRFQNLSALMIEEKNCAMYLREIRLNFKNKVPFVPYLGFFLTQIVHQACHQKMQETRWLKPNKRNDLSCSIEDDEGTCSPTGSYTNLSICQAGSRNDLSHVPEYSSLVPSYALHLHFMPRPQCHKASPSEPSSTSLSLSHSLGSLCTESELSSCRSSTAFSADEDDQFCRLEDIELYLTKDGIRQKSVDENQVLSSSKSSGILGCDSGPSTPQWRSASLEEDDQQFCRLEDSLLYMAKHHTRHSNGDDNSMCTDHGGASEGPYLSVAPVEVYHEAGDLSHSNRPTSGFTGKFRQPHSAMSPASGSRARLLKCRHITQVVSVNPKHSHSPTALLHRYQTSSLDCTIGFQSREDIRNLILNNHCNTEMENYVLSHLREPL